jgi:hypothetical protein
MGMTRDRAINTVVDVAFALLFVSIAVFVLSAAQLSSTPEQKRFDTDRTATVLGTATFNVTYSVGPVLSEAIETSEALEDDDNEEFREQRIAHETMAGHLKNAALGNLAVGSEQIVPTGRYYQSAIDSRLTTQLAGSQFETSVTAHWEPYPGSSLSGRGTVGVEPPPDRDIRTSAMTVPSGVGPTHERAVAAVEAGGEYAAVAEIIASAIINEYLPVVSSKHALERDGSVTILTQYRYERLATLLDGADVIAIREKIEQTDAEPAEANEELTAALTATLTTELQNQFDSPEAAARSVSTETVSITVRTWEP